MIAHAHFRRGGADGREPIAAPGDITSIAANYTPQQHYWGTITSKRPEQHSKAAIELAAFRAGVKPAALLQAINAGLVNG